MTITDWINSVSYDGNNIEEIRTSDLIRALESMGVKLESGEKTILHNFVSAGMS